MVNTLFGKSKLSGKLAFVFLTLLTIILLLNLFHFRTLKITTEHQQFITHSFQQLLLLKQLESTVHHQIQDTLEIFVRGDRNFDKFEEQKEKVLALFLEAQTFITTNREHELRQADEELKILEDLEADYILLTKRIKTLLKQQIAGGNINSANKIIEIIEEGFDGNFQNFLAEASEKEKQEIEEINEKIRKNLEGEAFIAWVLIVISLGFSLNAYNNLKSSAVSRSELEEINQTLQKEVSQKVNAESQAQDQRKNLYNILDSLPMAFHLQAPDYSVPFANKVFRDRFGSSLEKPCYQLMHNRSEPCEVCTTFKVFDHKKNETSVWDAQDGKTYLTVCTPFTDMDGSSLVMEMALDITEQENAKRQAEIAMIEAEKANHAKSDFLARMSHELRTPLNSILGFSQLLLMDQMNTLQPIQKENVNRILNGGQHLLELINEVLDLSKIESGSSNLNIENVSLLYLVQEVHELVEPMAAKDNISIQSSLEGDQDILVLADRVRLKQVLLNLTSNALKYNKSNGKVSIFCHQLQDAQIKISISDTGLGISEKDLKIIFEPFQRIQSSSQNIEGTGIGLSISKQLIKAMNGSIEVESELDRGSCFNIILPAGEGKDNSYNPAQLIEPIIQKSRPKTGKNYKILYIEDNLANMELVGCALFRSDIKFLQAPDARLGIDIAKAHKPDLILMDINLPGMDGYEALKIIRQDPTIGKTPIFALSANSMESDVLNGLKSGFDEYIPKPIRISDFVEKVNGVLR